MAKWTFADSPIGLVDQGPNNPTGEHFKSQDIFSALVRESIQNSLDVPLNTDKPVEVRYAFGKIEGELKDALREVEPHVHACSDAYNDSLQYQRMVTFLDEHKDGPISYLRVSDYNTTGMNYVKGDNTCGFYSFVQSIGNSSKNSEGAGGSYGFGKAAYYEFSNSRSVLVSSRTKDGQVAFQGCSMLCTHHLNGKKYGFSGFFDEETGEPVQDINNIPQKFRRETPGSDIYILHVDDNRDEMEAYEDSIIRSVLLNFWMAIYMKKLVVSFDWEDDGVDEVVISKDSIDELMEKYFPTMEDKTEISNEYCNPRPYYEAVKTAVPFVKDSEEEQNCVLFSNDNLKDVGVVKFYLMRNIGTRDRYLRMRKRYMVIDGIKLNGQRGISGVLICEDGVANDNLRKAEPPAHDMWDIKRVDKFKDQPETPEGKAYKAINAIRRYANNCIKDFFVNASDNETEITGLEEFLYATENLDGRDGKNNSRNGQETGNDTEYETGVHKTKPNGPVIVPLGVTSSKPGEVTITTTGPAGTTPGGYEGPIFPNEPNPNPRPTPPGPDPVPKPTYPVVDVMDEPNDERETKIRVIKPVSYRPKFKNTEEGLVYNLNIRTEEDLEKADLYITTQGEDGEEIIPLSWSEVGTVHNNMVNGVDLKAGVANEVNIRFEDNIKHLISLTAYVTK